MFFRATTKTLLSALVLFGFLFAIGCQQKQAEPVKKEEPVAQQPAKPAVDTVKKVEEVKPVVPDMKGSWNGTLDGYRATLTVSEQKDKSFSGTVKLAMREPISKSVTGEINVEKMTLSMKDVSASRVKGSYNGEFAKDGKSVKGSFTYAENKAKAPFSFSKK